MDRPLPPRPWYRKYLAHILAGACLLALVGYVSLHAFGPRRLSVSRDAYKIAEVAEAPFLEYVNVEGIVQPIQTIQVNAMESGFVERIVAEEGAMLSVGDTILVLTNPDLRNSIEDEMAAWQGSERNFQEQEIEMAQKSITLRQQTLDAEHQRNSLDKQLAQSREEFRMGIKSRAELDVIETDYAYQQRKAELQLQSLRHDSIATQLKREMAHAQRQAGNKRLRRAMQRTDLLVVRAPVAGQLSFLKVGIGQQIGSGTSVGEIKVMSQFKVHTQLSEYYIDRITVGLGANIQQDSLRFPLRISKVVPEVKDRNFDCDLIFTAHRPSNIRLGKSYRVNIELGRPERAVIIPRGDFFATTQGRWIYKLSPDGRTARRTEIELGRQNPQQYEVLSGLSPGDRVLVSGYSKFGNAEELRVE